MSDDGVVASDVPPRYLFFKITLLYLNSYALHAVPVKQPEGHIQRTNNKKNFLKIAICLHWLTLFICLPLPT